MKEMTIPTLKCLRCKGKWHPRKEKLPKTCPKCRSAFWNEPYVNKRKAK
jgi:Zn finger protein HypA/HybF involved in hydrogenase expression